MNLVFLRLVVFYRIDASSQLNVGPVNNGFEAQEEGPAFLTATKQSFEIVFTSPLSLINVNNDRALFHFQFMTNFITELRLSNGIYNDYQILNHGLVKLQIVVRLGITMASYILLFFLIF